MKKIGVTVTATSLVGAITLLACINSETGALPRPITFVPPEFGLSDVVLPDPSTLTEGLVGMGSSSPSFDVGRIVPPSLPESDPAHQREHYEAFLEQSPARRKGATREQRTDHAIALMFVGRHREAVRWLERIERDFPGHYSTATNLGTALELAGRLEQARHWIAESISRNPRAHDETEWLHLDILDARLQLRKNARWLTHRSVLGNHSEKSAAEIVEAIVYQMNERLNFVTAPDPIAADLFYEAGVRSKAGPSREWFFAQSLRFGELRRAAIEQAQSPAVTPD